MDKNGIARLQTLLETLRRGGSKSDPKPHKLILLLAVLDLLDSGEIVQNRITLNAALLSQFEKEFRQHAGQGDWCQPGPPFFHLRTASFWHHRVRPGREDAYARMRRVGGGLHRLNANVEYAFFDDATFALLSNGESRQYIRGPIVRLLEKEMATEREAGRLGMAFHEAFSFSVPAVAQVLSVVAAVGASDEMDGLSHGLLSAETTLGPNYVRAMPRYCVGSGLLGSDYRFTAFGEAVRRSDPNLSTPSTLWLIHYHLSALRGPGPEFWHYFVTHLLRPGEEVSTAEVGLALRQHAQERGRSVAERTAKTTASVVLGSYSKPDALGPLGLLQGVGSGCYTAASPASPPPLFAFAYALASHWEANWGEVTGVNLARVAEEGGIGPIFMMGGGLINRYLGDLQREGFAIVQRRTPPFQLTRNWESPQVFLERIYG